MDIFIKKEEITAVQLPINSTQTLLQRIKLEKIEEPAIKAQSQCKRRMFQKKGCFYEKPYDYKKFKRNIEAEEETFLYQGELQVDLRAIMQAGDNIQTSNPQLQNFREKFSSPFSAYRVPFIVEKQEGQCFTQVRLEKSIESLKDFEYLIKRLSSLQTILAYSHIEAIQEQEKKIKIQEPKRKMALRVYNKNYEKFLQALASKNSKKDSTHLFCKRCQPLFTQNDTLSNHNPNSNDNSSNHNNHSNNNDTSNRNNHNSNNHNKRGNSNSNSNNINNNNNNSTNTSNNINSNNNNINKGNSSNNSNNNISNHNSNNNKNNSTQSPQEVGGILIKKNEEEKVNSDESNQLHLMKQKQQQQQEQIKLEQIPLEIQFEMSEELFQIYKNHNKESIQMRNKIIESKFYNDKFIFAQKGHCHNNLEETIQIYGLSEQMIKLCFGVHPEESFSHFVLHNGIFLPFHDNYSYLQYLLMHLLDYQDREVSIRTFDGVVMKAYLRRFIYKLKETPLQNTEFILSDQLIVQQFLFDPQSIEDLINFRFEGQNQKYDDNKDINNINMYQTTTDLKYSQDVQNFLNAFYPNSVYNQFNSSNSSNEIQQKKLVKQENTNEQFVLKQEYFQLKQEQLPN